MRKIFFKIFKFLHLFLPAWNLGFLFYYFSLSYDYKIVTYLQTSASHQGKTLSSLPVQASVYSIALGWPEGGSTRQLRGTGSPSPLVIQAQGTLTQQNTISWALTVQTQFETPVPWNLEAPTEPLFCFFSYFGCTGSLLRCAGLLQSVMRS